MYGKFCTGDAYIVLQVRGAELARVLVRFALPDAECCEAWRRIVTPFTYCELMNVSVRDHWSEWGVVPSVLSLHAPLELHSPLCGCSVPSGVESPEVGQIRPVWPVYIEACPVLAVHLPNMVM